MAKNKTAFTEINAINFINSSVDNDQKKADNFCPIELVGE